MNDSESIAEALDGVAGAIQRLGLNDAGTHFGAIESHSMMMKECAEIVSRSLDYVAESLSEIARAIEERKS